MPGSVVIDTALGLVFVFLTLSLIASGATEWLGNRLNKRGEYLLRGLREMLDIPPATPEAPEASGTVPGRGGGWLIESPVRREMLECLAVQGADLRERLAHGRDEVRLEAPLADTVLSHPLIVALHRPGRPGRPPRSAGSPAPGAPPASPSGRTRWLSRLWPRRDMHLASYVSARTFAHSLVDLLVPDSAGRTSVNELVTRVERLPKGVPARSALLALLRASGSQVDAFRRGLEQWYDEQMGRVSGWYKRWAQWRLFLLGAGLAVAINVDSVSVGAALYRDQPVREAIVAQAVSAQGCPGEAGADREACIKRQTDVLRGLNLPIGWNAGAAAAACRGYHHGHSCWPAVQRWIPFWWHALADTGLPAILLKLLGWLLTAAAVSFGAPFWFDALSKLGSLRTTGRRPGENAPYLPPTDPAPGVRRPTNV